MAEANAPPQLPLAGISVLIIRPLRQAQRSAKLIEAAGGEPIIFPTIEICPVQDPRALDDLAYRISGYDMAIFISTNAVEWGMPYLISRIPPGLRFAAIGEATQKALLDWGIQSVIAPTGGYDSEALLALPPMQDVAGKRIVIFRGEGGRETLAEALRERGAQVDYVACYRRIRPRQDTSSLNARWRSGNIHAVSALSRESLQNLYHMLDQETQLMLAHTPVLVPHPHIAEAAQKLGLSDVRVTGAGDNALIKALKSCNKC